MRKPLMVLLASVTALPCAALLPRATQAHASGCTVAYVADVAFGNSFEGYATGGDTCGHAIVLTTQDWGRTWTPHALPAGTYGLDGISAPDGCHAWAAGSEPYNPATGVAPGVAVATADCGATWTLEPVPGSDAMGFISFVDHQHGWIAGGCCGGSSEIFSTSDGGHTWSNNLSAGLATWSRNVFGIKFANTLQGFAIAADESGPLGAVIATVDGGLTWTRQAFVPQGLYGGDIDVARDGLHAWVVGQGGGIGLPFGIWSTSTGGAAWQPVAPSSPSPPSFGGVSFITTSEGWVTAGSVILHSLSGGSSWTQQSLPAGIAGAGRIAAHGINSACATASDTSRNPAIICTWNDGITWSRVL